MASNVAEFYKNKNIFITGGTGFVGIALVEKILRSCPDVGKVSKIKSDYIYLINT